MANKRRYRSGLVLGGWCIVALMALAGPACPADVEPNDDCAAATAVAAQRPPVSAPGQLTPGRGDVDFYRVLAVPGAALDIKLVGVPGGAGAQPDPLLAYLGDGCRPVASSGDAIGPISRLAVRVPESGRFWLAATGEGDVGLIGDHHESGAYVLQLDGMPSIGSVSGQILGTRTGRPAGSRSVTLFWCHDAADPYNCVAPMASLATVGGAFSFTVDWDGSPLAPGAYRVALNRDVGAPRWSEPFTVRESEHFVVPVLYEEEQETPAPAVLGSIRGRVVDARTGEGVSGATHPFASVSFQLDWCWDDCGGYSRTPDAEGRFVLEAVGDEKPPASGYLVSVSALGYQSVDRLAIGHVAPGEHLDIGDIALEPSPVRLEITAHCQEQVDSGGLCRYRVVATNDAAWKVRGTVWSTAESGTSAFVASTRFQVGRLARLTLAPGQSQSLYFNLNLPPDLPELAFLCVKAHFGEGDRDAYYHPSAEASFCAQKLESGLSERSSREIRPLSGTARVPSE